jgi:hypothetical protein
MAINFPSSPATNDTFTGPTGLEYIFDGVKWRSFKPSEPVVGTFNANSAISLSAGGTNQNITLTPSGTGVVTTPASVGIGTTTPSSLLTIDGGLITTINYAATPQIRFNYAAGTKASPTAIASSVPVAAVYGFGYDGVSFRNTSGILMYSDGAISSVSSPGFILFATTPFGATSTTERMRITSAGNVGIGTGSPDRTGTTTATNTILEVNGSITLPYGVTGAEPLRIGVFNNTNFVPGTSSVGNAIGFTISNWNTLNDGSGSTYLQAGVDAGNGGIQLQARKTGVGVVSRLADFSIATSQFFTSDTERMRIDSTGLVGIATGGTTRFALSLGTTTSTGTATPITLDLGGTYSSTAGANPKLRLYWDGTNAFGLGISSNQLDYVVPASASHVWYTVGTERMRIAANGNIGIGNTTPSVALEVTGNIKDTLGLVRAAPIQTKSGAYVVVAADAGATIYISTGGVTINASILSAGDMITIVNNSASNQTITAGASVTFRLAGTATTGNRTLAQYGMATFLCVVGGATPTFHCSGAGLT